MPRLTILTLALTAAVAASAAPVKPAKKTPAPKKPAAEEMLPSIEVGKPPLSTPRVPQLEAVAPAVAPTQPVQKTVPKKPAPAVQSTTESKRPAASTAPQLKAPAVATTPALVKPTKDSPEPKKPAATELSTIEIGKLKAAVPSTAAAIKPVQKSPEIKKGAPTPKAIVEIGSSPTSAVRAPQTTVFAATAAPLKPAKKTSAPKPAAAAQPTAKPPQASVERPAPKPAPRPPQPALAPKIEGPTAYTLSAPIDVAAMIREGRATFTSSKVISGKTEHLFDPNRSTEVMCLSMSTGPAYWQITLDRARSLDAVDLLFGDGGPYQWTLSGANSSAELVSRQGSYRVIVPARSAEADDQVVFPMSADPLPPLRVYRLEAKPAAGAGEVRLSALALWTTQELKRVDVDAMIPRVGVGSRLPLKAIGTFDLGGRQNLTPDVTWEVSPPDTGKVDSLVRLEGKEPGKATVTAIFKDTRSNPLAVDVIADGKPDWSVTYIERGPRVPIDGPQPKIGQKVVWFAHVKNYGSAEAPQMAAEWRVDGKKHVATTVAKLDRFQETDVMLPLVWDGKRHHVELVVDPTNQVAEESEANNSLAVATDSLAVGMWVEESVVRYFHQKQRDLGVGSNGWEDWAQRQVASWNKFQAQAAGLFQPASEAGIRWRIDRLLIVGDGLLPMAGGSPEQNPDRRERSVHLMLGFPAVDPARSPYRQTSKATPENPFFMQRNLLRSLTRAVYPKPALAPPAPTQAAGG